MNKINSLEQLSEFASGLPGVIVGKREHFKQRRGVEFISVSIDQSFAEDDDTLSETYEPFLVVTHNSSGRFSISKRNNSGYDGLAQSIAKSGSTFIVEDLLKCIDTLKHEIKAEIQSRKEVRLSREAHRNLEEQERAELRILGFGPNNGYRKDMALVGVSEADRSNPKNSVTHIDVGVLKIKLEVPISVDDAEEKVKRIRAFAESMGIRFTVPKPSN